MTTMTTQTQFALQEACTLLLMKPMLADTHSMATYCLDKLPKHHSKSQPALLTKKDTPPSCSQWEAALEKKLWVGQRPQALSQRPVQPGGGQEHPLQLLYPEGLADELLDARVPALLVHDLRARVGPLSSFSGSHNRCHAWETCHSANLK